MTKKKAIIIIGGSHLQIKQIQWAKELNLFVIVTDKNSQVPGREFADEFVVIDGTDIPSFFSLVESLTKKIDLIGIYSGSDFGLMTVSKVSERFNLPSCSSESVKSSLDKYNSKIKWKKDGIATPDGMRVTNYDEMNNVVTKLGMPLIVKPIDSSGSSGISSVYKLADIKKAFDLAQIFSKSVIFEKIVEGIHIDVNGVFMNGEFIKCGMAERFFSSIPFHYPVWGTYPASLKNEQKEQVFELVRKSAESLGISQGPVKADVIFSNNNPIIIELTTRFHGDVLTSLTMGLVTNMNPIKMWFEYLLNKKIPNTKKFSEPNKTSGWIGLFPKEQGILENIQGIKEVKKMDGISDVLIHVKKGAKLKKPKDNTSLCGFILGTSENKTTLHEILIKAQSKIKFIIKNY